MDTRTGLGGNTGPVGPGGVVTLHVPTPPGASAVVLNVAGTEPTAGTFVSVYPASAPRPNASNLNLVPGETRANLVTVAVGDDGTLAFYNNAGFTHVIADLAGFYGGGGDEAGFTALPPSRVLDTRDNNSPVGPNGSIELDLSDRVPASATAVSLSVAGVTGSPAPDTFVTVWPAGTDRPLASTLNLTQGEARPIAATVALGAGRKLALYNHVGTVHLIVDLAGFYTPDYGAMFQSVVPRRVLDTRVGTGAPVGPVGPNQRLSLNLNNVAPPQAVGVVMNLAGTEPTDFTFVSAVPDQSASDITTSNLNLAPGQTAPNMVNVALGPFGSIDLYNHIGNVHLVADFAGYFLFNPGRCLTDCVVAFGSNTFGELGVGLRGRVDSPRPVFGLSDAIAVAGAGAGATGYALRSNGTVVAWGYNATGQLGNGWSGGRSVAAFRSLVPVPVLGLDRITAIAAGNRIALALRDDGTVWRWGEFRRNPGIAVAVPEQVPGLTGVTAIAAADRTGFALRSDHTVVAWGADSFGLLGSGRPVDWTDTPIQVSGLTDIASIGAGGGSSFAVKSDGTVWSWGDNTGGQLGTGATCPPPDSFCFSAVPVQASGLTGITSVASDGGRVFAIEGANAVWGWGDNFNGGLGIDVPCSSNCAVRTPTRLPGLTNVTSVAAINFWGGLATRDDRTVWGWGQNAQVGPFLSLHPVQLPNLSGATSVAATGSAGLALVPNSR